MSGNVKDAAVRSTSKAPTKRDGQAKATRARIIGAAGDLFVRRGYAATTLDQIAAAAGVAVQTVYFHFANKRTILKEVVDVASVGDDLPVPPLERPWVRQLGTEPDAHEVVGICIRNSRVNFERVAPIMTIVRDAAANDPDMAAQWEVDAQQRLTAHRVLAQRLGDLQALRPRLSVEEATDIIYALISLELYILLTTERGWTPAHWECWVNDIVTGAVLH